MSVKNLKSMMGIVHKDINRNDIRNLLRAYAGAIALDQIRVDALTPDCFHSEYNRSAWVQYRRSHFPILNQLRLTTRDLSKASVAAIGFVAATREPVIIRKTIVNLLSNITCKAYANKDESTAPVFFSTMIESVGTDSINSEGFLRVNAKARLAKWVNFVDPIFIAEDPECQYLPQLLKSLEET